MYRLRATNFITSAKEVLNSRPFVYPSIHPSVRVRSYFRPFRSLSVFSFIHFIVWIQKIINDPDCLIDFLLGGVKHFRIGGRMHSPSSCSILSMRIWIWGFSGVVILWNFVNQQTNVQTKKDKIESLTIQIGPLTFYWEVLKISKLTEVFTLRVLVFYCSTTIIWLEK